MYPYDMTCSTLHIHKYFVKINYLISLQIGQLKYSKDHLNFLPVRVDVKNTNLATTAVRLLNDFQNHKLRN